MWTHAFTRTSATFDAVMAFAHRARCRTRDSIKATRNGTQASVTPSRTSDPRNQQFRRLPRGSNPQHRRASAARPPLKKQTVAGSSSNSHVAAKRCISCMLRMAMVLPSLVASILNSRATTPLSPASRLGNSWLRAVMSV